MTFLHQEGQQKSDYKRGNPSSRCRLTTDNCCRMLHQKQTMSITENLVFVVFAGWWWWTGFNSNCSKLSKTSAALFFSILLLLLSNSGSPFISQGMETCSHQRNRVGKMHCAGPSAARHTFIQKKTKTNNRAKCGHQTTRQPSVAEPRDAAEPQEASS